MRWRLIGLSILSMTFCGRLAADAMLPFSVLSKNERGTLIIRGRLAAAAYPDGRIPDGWRVLNPLEMSSVRDNVLEWRAARVADGFVCFDSGLRVRLLRSLNETRVCLSLSGCDLRGWGLLCAGWKDVDDVMDMLFKGKEDDQYRQALALAEAMLKAFDGCELDVVGHSLGGSMTLYVVSKCDDFSNRIHGYTFNALGISRKMRQEIGAYQITRCNRLVTNVKDTADPISNRFVGRYAPRYGLVYVLGKHTENMDEVLRNKAVRLDLKRHGITRLIELMENE